MKTSAETRRDDAGFSLVEIMVVITIMALALAVAMPNLASSARLHKLRSASGELHSTLVKARSIAVTKGATVTVAINADTGTFILLQDLDNDGNFDTLHLPKTMPPGITIRNVDFNGGEIISFNAQGVPSSAGSVLIGSPDGDLKSIRVAAGSGAASIVTPEGPQAPQI